MTNNLPYDPFSLERLHARLKLEMDDRIQKAFAPIIRKCPAEETANCYGRRPNRKGHRVEELIHADDVLAEIRRGGAAPAAPHGRARPAVPAAAGSELAVPAHSFNDMIFDTSFRGYDRRQVDDYINAVTIDYNEICEKNAELEKRNRSLSKSLFILNIPHDENEAAI